MENFIFYAAINISWKIFWNPWSISGWYISSNTSLKLYFEQLDWQLALSYQIAKNEMFQQICYHVLKLAFVVWAVSKSLLPNDSFTK